MLRTHTTALVAAVLVTACTGGTTVVVEPSVTAQPSTCDEEVGG